MDTKNIDADCPSNNPTLAKLVEDFTRAVKATDPTILNAYAHISLDGDIDVITFNRQTKPIEGGHEPADAAVEAPFMCSLPAEKVQAVSNNIDMKGGVLAKSIAAKHLSSLLLEEIQRLLGGNKGKKVGTGAREFTIYESTLDQIMWLAGEVWEVNGDLANQVDDLECDFVEFSNAAYYATHDETGKPIADGKAVRS